MDETGLNLVVWKDVCKPKHHGGIGIRKIREANKALLLKWLWRFRVEDNSLRRQVVVGKYGVANCWESKTPNKANEAGCLQGIMNPVEMFKRAIRIEVGSGLSTLFWKDS